MKNQLYIPKKCKVGFNLRKDTYTGKLGYIIYHDGKVWRKETSWESWREKYIGDDEYEKLKQNAFNTSVKQTTDNYNRIVTAYEAHQAGTNHLQDYYSNSYAEVAKKTLAQYLKQQNIGEGDYEKFVFYSNKITADKGIIPVEFDNVPTEGFVLNKKAGGTSHGWDARQTYCRVWDPRGFEFEITIPNLLFILQETNSLKGKGLEGEFVYSWDGKDLVLIPTSCQEYKSSAAFTELQGGKVAAKDLVAGYSYKTKKNEILIYIGKFEFFDQQYSWKDVKFSKKFVFVDIKGGFVGLESVASLAGVTSETVISNFAELIEKYSKSDYSGVKAISLNPTTFTKKSNNGRSLYRDDYNDNDYAYATAYKEEKPNVYRRYNFYPNVRELGGNSYWDKKYETLGFRLKPISEITYNDGKLIEKKLSNKKIEDELSLEMVNKLGFGEVSVILNSGKKVKLK